MLTSPLFLRDKNHDTLLDTAFSGSEEFQFILTVPPKPVPGTVSKHLTFQRACAYLTPLHVPKYPS